MANGGHGVVKGRRVVVVVVLVVDWDIKAQLEQGNTDELTTDGYRLSGLVRALVTRPEYIEAGRFGEGE